MRIAAALLLAGLAVPSPAQTLCEQVRALIADPTVAEAHWGISVVRPDGTTVCEVSPAKLFRPASNNKIFTTAAAIALLGFTRTFTTTVLGSFDPATGIVTGDLTLAGGGDANLDSNDLPYLPAGQRPKISAPFAFHDLEDLAAQLAARGVKTVTGDLIGDDTAFPYEPYPPSWNADDFTWGYGAPVSALTIADNQLHLTVTPGIITGAPGHESYPRANVSLEQHGIDYYTLLNQVVTASAGAAAGVGVERLPGSRMIRVYGSIAADAPADSEQIAIDDPAAYAAMAFRSVLTSHGIIVNGLTRAKHRPATQGLGFQAQVAARGQEELTVAGGEGGGSCSTATKPPVLVQHSSLPLLDDVTLTNKISQNLHAELLLHALGRRVFCGQGSNVEGVRMVRAFALYAGVLAGDLVLYDGSGLSDHDLVTPRAFTTFLAYAARQPWFSQWRATLPAAGADGSFTKRFPTLKGRLWAKTGTLGESRALSGYLTTITGQTLIFSILVDDHTPTSTADRTTMDKIVTTLAASSPTD